MNAVTIMQGQRFALVSYGNGLSYALQPLVHGDDLFVQGDEAGQFRSELEAFEQKHPHWHVDDVLSHMLDIWT